MIFLERITDANLISARSYGIEIEIEAMCDWLEEVDRRDDLPIWSEAMKSMLCKFEATLSDVVVHAWPVPADPVVVALCAWAHAALACLYRVKRRATQARPAGCNDYGRGTGTSESANFIV